MLSAKSTNPRLPASSPVIDQKRSGTENALPLRPPHFDRTVSEAPILSSLQNAPDSPPKRSRTSISDSPGVQRPKKRVPWRGRTCIISLPPIDGTGKPYRSDYLRRDDVSERLRHWEEQEYDTTGFVLAPDPQDLEGDASKGQSRAIFPTPADEVRERESYAYRVSLPDREEWEAYVARLKEEKLRALGVSFGDEDPSTSSAPVIPTMSRNVSNQSSLMAISPSIVSPSASIAGQFTNQAFQLPFDSSNNGSRIPSASSQAYQQPGKPNVSHFPRYSMAMPNGNPPFDLPYPQSTPPGTWTPQHQYGSQPGSRIMSPTVNGHTQNINTILSPAPPVNQVNTPPMSAHNPRIVLAQMQKEQARLQAHHLAQQHQQQQLLFANSMSAYVQPNASSNELHPVRYNSQPEIASPVPRGHRQNLSETLQKEIEEAESLLPATTAKEHANDDTLLSATAAAAVGKAESASSSPELEDLDHNLPEAEIETNPSLSSSPFADEDTELKQKKGHESKPSVYGLNVNAAEFKPKAPVSDIFAFSGNRSSQVGPNEVHSIQTRGPSHGGLNVEAPVFIPGSAPPRATTMPSREFSFSSSGPAYKPDAPVPMLNGSRPSVSSIDSNPVLVNGPEKKIFGNIDYSKAIKPPKTSRAIPIVKPDKSDSESGADADGQEDESGRITQPEGRQKRLRRHDADGDQIPLFATPPPAIVPDQLGSVSPLSAAGTISDDITPLKDAAHQLKEIIDELPASDVSSLSAEDDISAPFSFTNAQEAASFSAALPLVSPPIRHGRDEDRELPHATLYAEEDFPVDPVLTASSLPGNDGTRDYSPNYAASPSKQPSRFEDTVARDRGTSNEEDTSKSVSSSKSADRPIYLENDHVVHDADPVVHGNIRDFALNAAIDGVAYLDPSLEEINDVMKHLNDEDSDLGVVRNPSPWRSRSPIRSPIPGHLESSTRHQMLPPLQLRSDAPSPSPNRLHGPIQYLPPTESESADTADVEMVARNARFSPSYRPSRTDVHHLNSPGSPSISDWDDAISSVDELQLQRKTAFFDNRVDKLIGSIVQQHMSPLEKTLAGIQASLTALSSRANSRRPRRTLSDEIEHSDADDEDDEDAASSSRMKSPLRDRRFEKLKASIQEIAAAQQNLVPATQLAEVVQAVNDLKTSMQEAPASTGNIKSVVEEAIGKQLRGKSAPITSSHQSATAEKSQLQIAGLESMLKIAEARAEDELKARRATEDALADSQRLLRGALQEAAEQRESAEETEQSLAAFHQERHEGLRHAAMLEGSQESLQKAAAELSEKNAALEATLEEYRLSSTEWRTEIEDERSQNRDLNRTINALRSELDDGISGRELLRSQISRLQEDMARMSGDIARNQAIRYTQEQELKSELDILGSRLEADSRTRERLEAEVARLEKQEKEASKAYFMLEQVRQAHTESEALLSQLRIESHEHQNVAARFERELVDARESGRMEVQRTKTAMEADLEMAKNQVNIVRADLESTIERLQARLDNTTADSETVRARNELMLEEASDSRNQALREAAEAREAALQEHYRFHERTLADVRSEHERALNNILEDKQRSETHLTQRLALADEKVMHYTDRAAHLEEKLEIAKSAALAAVQAAQAKKPTSSPSASRGSWSQATGLPERISPQALRESILVLQEQLQEREGRIENLEQELSQVDRDAPAKIKDQDMEITWLRELLGVRIDDLEDIINTLSRPVYNREAVKDAAIRLKANLQMEQQEKERAMAGGQSFPSLASISNLAASPRAFPLAAAAAWGNWRKARETPLSSLSAMANGSADQTPSRSSPSAQSFLSGLLTPPSTNLRQTPLSQANGSISRPTSSNRPLGPYSTPRQSFSAHNPVSPLKNQASPMTPPLMRKASYDQDAESADFEQNSPEHTGADDEPFGPSLGSILSTT